MGSRGSAKWLRQTCIENISEEQDEEKKSYGDNEKEKGC
jgi:hypothetical protein